MKAPTQRLPIKKDPINMGFSFLYICIEAKTKRAPKKQTNGINKKKELFAKLHSIRVNRVNAGIALLVS